MENSVIPFKSYTIYVLDSFLAFALSSFSFGMYVTHGGLSSYIGMVTMALLYVLVLTLLIKRFIQLFSLAALMLFIPIAPLLVLLFIIALIPLLHALK